MAYQESDFSPCWRSFLWLATTEGRNGGHLCRGVTAAPGLSLLIRRVGRSLRSQGCSEQREES